MASLDEFSLIRALTDHRQSPSFLQSSGVVTGIGDDAAVVNVKKGFQIVVSCDTMVENIHFSAVTIHDHDLGYKALAVNVSDMAAMGATPKFALVSLCIPEHVDQERLRIIYDGLYECANLYNVAIVGGDVSSTYDSFSLTVTVIGEVPAGEALLRSGARAGDVVFVTGRTGVSAAGLHDLQTRNKVRNQMAAPYCDIPLKAYALVQAHCRPIPQVQAGILLGQSHACTALNDVSDGLASEVWEIAEASQCGIVLDEKRLPVCGSLREFAVSSGVDPMEWILYGGEDYQLVGTLRADQAEVVQDQLAQHGLSLYFIGEVVEGPVGVKLTRKDGQIVSINKKGYHHVV